MDADDHGDGGDGQVLTADHVQDIDGGEDQQAFGGAGDRDDADGAFACGGIGRRVTCGAHHGPVDQACRQERRKGQFPPRLLGLDQGENGPQGGEDVENNDAGAAHGNLVFRIPCVAPAS